ncbi:MAG: GGDEF domain-containing protein [Alphaproteobacteria bacterium]|nr:GGDEF domain-containing protein [Alphaproteobacteria bacterium]
MERHDIPPTPPNFSIWYSYASGRQPGLDRKPDHPIGDGCAPAALPSKKTRRAPPSRTAAGYRPPDADLEFDEVTAQLLDTLSLTREEVAEYSDDLRAFSKRLDDRQLAELGSLIASVLNETRKVQVKNQHLEAALKASTDETQDLRRNIVDARVEALTDPLTGLGNRQSFERGLAEWAHRAETNTEPLSLLMFDVDNFKGFNDSFGHQLGDQVLKLVATILGECVKGRDVVARYGGEEFAIILPKTGLQSACAVADQIRVAVASRALTRKNTGEKLGRITVSIGAAQLRVGERPEEIVARADEALYAARQAGRNCVVADDRVYEGAASLAKTEVSISAF